jgi:type ISP restriction-modification system protein/N-6 DNA methylase
MPGENAARTSTEATAPIWLRKAVSEFGKQCQAKLAGPGNREAAIRSPLESLLCTVAGRIGVKAIFHDEVRDAERRVRPDFAVSIDGAIGAHVEIKAPGRQLDSAKFTRHDRQQWERQHDLPNLLYTNGTEWRLYQDSELWAEPILLSGGDLATAGRDLSPPAGLETLLARFLRWKPQRITTVGALVKAVVPRTRLLRYEVLGQLAAEKAAAEDANKSQQPFTGLAKDWRALLFPRADDEVFADGYAQTVTFALLLARTEGIELAGRSLHEVGATLKHKNSLMGSALRLLTDDVTASFHGTLDLLIRIIGAVDWPKVQCGSGDTYLYLYQHFLEQYDNDRRKKSGSYYTPREVVEPMVRLTEEALIGHLQMREGFRHDEMRAIDPAMGTGTYLHTILERVAQAAALVDGPGAVPGAVSQAAERVMGFEQQMCPYTVAELRATSLLTHHDAMPPPSGMRMYVADTLDDPHAEQAQIAYMPEPIAKHHHEASAIKTGTNATVVIGNPPFRQLANGEGVWVEKGGRAHGDMARAILEDFRVDAGKSQAKLKNTYVYFWRWATWKAWESTPDQPDGDAGVVCFISPSSYLTGPAYARMREYLRRRASEGWIIDLTPEGHIPPVPTRIFPSVKQPLAIGLFVRKPDTSDQFAARIRYRAVSGRQQDKYTALAAIGLDDGGWREVRDGWTDPFTPAPGGQWDSHPALSDLMPWRSPGVFPTRTWVYSPSAATLYKRWRVLLAETDPEKRAILLKVRRGAKIGKTEAPLPGTDTHHARHPLPQDRVTLPNPVQVGFRSFDRQWVLPDSRLMERPRRDLWAARIPGQVFVIEQHRHAIWDGPGIVFSALIPDYHHFNNRGGRTLPFLHPDGAANLVPGFRQALSAALDRDVKDAEVLAYIAAVVAHPAYTRIFRDELRTPGIRVPVTGDPDLWAQAIQIGEQVIWLHTYGAACHGPDRPAGNVRLAEDSDLRPPKCTEAVSSLPETMSYDEDRATVVIGDGEFAPVRRAVWEYTVGGRNVLSSWFNYRKKNPSGKKTSQLDHIRPDNWIPDWTTDAVNLLTVLTRLTAIEPIQAEFLSRILTGKLLSAGELAAAGTRWPHTDKDRKPRYAYDSLGPMAGQATLVI